jgi:hypothetical protein
MTVFDEKCGSVSVRIHDVDHGPPHCHVAGLPRGGSVIVNLLTLEVTRPEGMCLPIALRRLLRARQDEMLAAWERVVSTDRNR